MAQPIPEEYRNIEIMLDIEKNTIVRLGDLTPNWWI